MNYGCSACKGADNSIPFQNYITNAEQAAGRIQNFYLGLAATCTEGAKASALGA